MKKVKRTMMSIICVVVLWIVSVVPVSAANPDGYICRHGYHTFGDYKMNYGVGEYGNNRRYFWMTGFNSTYQTYIRNAVDEWVHTTDSGPRVTTSISIRETTVKQNALFEFHNKFHGTYTLGQTSFHMYDREISLNAQGALTENYGWAMMDICVSTLDNPSFAISAAQKKATISHELGHGMGLSHQNTRPASIMCQNQYGRYATRADAQDCRTINHIYG